MAKVTLGARPKSFQKVVEFPMLDGTTGSITVTFKYRTRTEFGKLVDELMASAKAAPAGDGEFSLSDLMARTNDSNGAYLLKVVDGWDLDAPLTAANAQQLADEIPAAAAAIMEGYRTAITEGRLGN